MNYDEFTVGWISAIPAELAAANAMLDEKYEEIQGLNSSDPNLYSFGLIGKHKVVIACLPAGVYGITSAATLANQMQNSFKSIKIGLMVGIGGGVPTKENDLRLGDVVVSQPKDRFGGVVQYDIGKRTPEGKFVRTGALDKPPPILLKALSTMQAESDGPGFELGKYLHETLQKIPRMQVKFGHPHERDDLYRADYEHDSNRPGCTSCDRRKLIKRLDRREPEVHYGTIASGNSVIRSAAERDRLNADLGGITCFEMEAAGLMDNFPCLVIRGIGDYADSHKNDTWQRYAAATAAAYAKRLVTIMPNRDIKGSMATQQSVSPHSQSPPVSRPPFALQPVSSNQLLPESQYPFYQQKALPPNQFPFGFEQQSTYQRTLHSNPSSPELGQQLSIQQRTPPSTQSSLGFEQQSANQGALSSYQSSPNLGQLLIQERALASDQFSPSFEPLSSKQGASPPNQVRPPGTGPRSACSIPAANQVSAESVAMNHLKPRPPINRTGHSDTDLMRYEGNGRQFGGIQRKSVGYQSETSMGYKQEPKMIYSQPPRIDQTRKSHQPVHYQPGSPIPLLPLPAMQPEPSRSRTPAVTYSTASRQYTSPAVGFNTPPAAVIHSPPSATSPAARKGTLEATRAVEKAFHGQGHSTALELGHGSANANQSDHDHRSVKASSGGHDKLKSGAPVIDDRNEASSKGSNKHRGAAHVNAGRNGREDGGSKSENGKNGDKAIENSHQDGDGDDGRDHDFGSNQKSDRDLGGVPHEPTPNAGKRIGEADEYYHGNIPYSYREPGQVPHEPTSNAGERNDEAEDHHGKVSLWDREPSKTSYGSIPVIGGRSGEAAESYHDQTSGWDREPSEIPHPSKRYEADEHDYEGDGQLNRANPRYQTLDSPAINGEADEYYHEGDGQPYLATRAISPHIASDPPAISDESSECYSDQEGYPNRETDNIPDRPSLPSGDRGYSDNGDVEEENLWCGACCCDNDNNEEEGGNMLCCCGGDDDGEGQESNPWCGDCCGDNDEDDDNKNHDSCCNVM